MLASLIRQISFLVVYLQNFNSDTVLVYTRAQTNSGFYYSNILYSQLPNIRIFFFSIDMDEISIILRLYKMSL